MKLRSKALSGVYAVLYLVAIFGLIELARAVFPR